MAVGAKAGFFSRKIPGGMFLFTDETDTTGDRWWVDSGSATGADSVGAGTNPDQPFLTWDFAIGRANANNGDRIYLMPGHAENITTATGVNIDVAGIETVGLGCGGDIPTISFTAAAGSVTVGAASATMRNIKFLANFATGVTTGLTIAAAGDNCTLDRCLFRDTSAANEFLLHATIATTVTDLTIKDSSFVTLAGSATNSLLFSGTTSDVVIRDNHWFVITTDSVIDHLTDAATNIWLDNNRIVNQDTATAGYLIDCHASSTGLASNNRGAYNKVDAEVTKGAAMWWVENYFTNTIAESGLLEPATSHAIP